jgi:thioredoxin reductase (NADPH)
MAKPVLLTIDDDPAVLRSVERDLRKRYADRYRVLAAKSGQEALDTLNQLEKRKEPVALMLADHRMPEMTGVEMLERAIKIYPEAKRVLLTAYADTDAAIRAINQVHLHHYLLKPWDPPEQNLYPVLDDLLEDWTSTYRPPFQGIRIVGDRWSPRTHALKDFLARNHVPYIWLDPDRQANDAEIGEYLGKCPGCKLPFVVLENGDIEQDPELSRLADRVGIRRSAESKFYDLAIVGGGPAGLAAAVYGASEGLRTVMIEREAPGGQAGMSSKIENYLGFPSGLTGADLARRAVAQAKRFGVEILTPQEAYSLRVDGTYRVLQLDDKIEISCHALLIATGVQWRKLDIPGVDKLTGAGVYYGAAMTEAISCQDEDVYIVGGANSAGQGAMYFSRYARRVIMLLRGDGLSATMSQYLIDQIQSTPNIEVQTRAQVVEAHGEDHLESITISCGHTNTNTTVPASGLFIFIGAEPRTDWLGEVVARDERGFILTGPDLRRGGKQPLGWPLDRDPFLLETCVPGVFAVGDVRHGSVKRVASGVGEGAIAIQFVHQYLSKL